jgi:hypothetical protein
MFGELFTFYWWLPGGTAQACSRRGAAASPLLGVRRAPHAMLRQRQLPGIAAAAAIATAPSVAPHEACRRPFPSIHGAITRLCQCAQVIVSRWIDSQPRALYSPYRAYSPRVTALARSRAGPLLVRMLRIASCQTDLARQPP